MTTKRRALTGFRKMKDDELLVQAATTHQAMSNNLNFPNPVPDLLDLQAALEDYQERLGAAKQKGGYYESSLKNDSRRALEAILKQLAFHVNIVAEGNLSSILSSGFPLSSTVSEVYAPEIPVGLRLQDGRQSGYMRFDFGKVANTLLYEYQYTSERNADGEMDWGLSFKTTSSVNNIISPVTPGVIYFARVRAINGKGIGDWSEHVSLMAR